MSIKALNPALISGTILWKSFGSASHGVVSGRSIKHKEVVMEQKQNKKALGICAVVFAIFIAVVGVVLGATGLVRYPQRTTGWWLCWAATLIGAANMILGALIIR